MSLLLRCVGWLVVVVVLPVFQWDAVENEWVAVRPPPASDPRLHELGEFLDPNFLLNDEHLEKDFSTSATVALQGEIPEFPPRRMLHAMALFGVLGTKSRDRGVELPKLVVYGGYNGNTMLDDVWELSLRNPDEGFEFNSQGANSMLCCVVSYAGHSRVAFVI